MRPHFVIFLKNGTPLELNGKTMVYNLFSPYGRNAFVHARLSLTKKYPGLISIAETKGEYHIPKKSILAGYEQIIKCDKFPSMCVSTAFIEYSRKLSYAETLA